MTTLRRGSRGAAVRALQELLNWPITAPRVTVDGDYGEVTERAVKAAQQRLGLVVDGVAGPQTLAALKIEARTIKVRRVEPDKSAMALPSPMGQAPAVAAAPPPNAGALRLLDTARPIAEIIVHCTATPDGKDYTVADIRAWHRQRGWSDIGYHYVVARDGTVMVGRPVGQIGAHVEGHNTGTIGIAYIGGLMADAKTPKDTRTPAQRASLLWLAGQLAAKHSGVRRVSGHNQYAAKACPSFDVRRDPLGAVAA